SEELVARSESGDFIFGQTQQASERSAYGCLVVDHGDVKTGAGHAPDVQAERTSPKLAFGLVSPANQSDESFRGELGGGADDVEVGERGFAPIPSCAAKCISSATVRACIRSMIRAR